MYTRYCPSHSLGGSSRTTIILSQGEGNSKDVGRQHDGITCQQPHDKVSADLHCKGNLEANMDVCRQYNFFNNIRAYQFQGEFLFKSFGITEEVTSLRTVRSGLLNIESIYLIVFVIFELIVTQLKLLILLG